MTDIQVIQIDPSTRRVTLQMGHKAISGITQLLQMVVLSLLNVPGKDILDPDMGGGLPEMIGSNMDAEDSTEVLGEVTRRIRKTESEILASQVGLNVPASERLKELRVLGVSRGNQIDEILVRLRIINELGQTSDVVI